MPGEGWLPHQGLSRWRCIRCRYTGAMDHGVSLEIAPLLVRHLSPRDLLVSAATLMLEIDAETIGSTAPGDGLLFAVECADDSGCQYSLAARIASDGFYVARNEDSAGVSTEGLVGHVICWVGWGPEELFVHLQQPSSGVHRKDRLRTRPITPPNRLALWAREQEIFPRTTYSTSASFQNEVIGAMLAIDHRIAELGSPHAFWDVRYGARGAVTLQTPKREPNAHPTIEAMLYNIATAKNIDFSREGRAGPGNLDFLATGVLDTGQIAKACVEFKNAHSSDIFDGLTKQLPAYMRSKQTDLGIYAVLWYKGSHFDKPTKYDLKGLQTALNIASVRSGLSLRIRTIILDLAHPSPPSKL